MVMLQDQPGFPSLIWFALPDKTHNEHKRPGYSEVLRQAEPWHSRPSYLLSLLTLFPMSILLSTRTLQPTSCSGFPQGTLVAAEATQTPRTVCSLPWRGRGLREIGREGFGSPAPGGLGLEGRSGSGMRPGWGLGCPLHWMTLESPFLLWDERSLWRDGTGPHLKSLSAPADSDGKCQTP